MQVKDNQQQLLDDCCITARHDTPLEVYSAPSESGHGRIERRECRVFDCRFTTDPQWQELIAQIVEVRRLRECFNTRKKAWERSEEISFYISTTRRSAQEYNTLIRGHWGIENRNHHVRDVTFGEDASRIRKNPGTMARCRSFALNICRANGLSNIAQTRYKNALNAKILRKLQYLWT